MRLPHNRKYSICRCLYSDLSRLYLLRVFDLATPYSGRVRSPGPVPKYLLFAFRATDRCYKNRLTRHGFAYANTRESRNLRSKTQIVFGACSANNAFARNWGSCSRVHAVDRIAPKYAEESPPELTGGDAWSERLCRNRIKPFDLNRYFSQR